MTLSVSNLKWLALWSVATLVVSTTLSELAYALGPQPATPCACEAEGYCAPQGPWGYSQTQWRPWPGDEVATPAEIQAQQESSYPQLPGSEEPAPEREGLRGPEPQEKRRKKKSDDGAPLPGAEVEADIPAALPGVEAPIDGGFGIPDGLGPEDPGVGPVEPEVDLEQPAGVQPEAEDAPSEDLFDPFGQTGPELQPVEQPSRSTTQAPQRGESNGPPPLPSSLQKFSRALPQKAPVFTQAKRRTSVPTTTMALAR